MSMKIIHIQYKTTILRRQTYSKFDELPHTLYCTCCMCGFSGATRGALFRPYRLYGTSWKITTPVHHIFDTIGAQPPSIFSGSAVGLIDEISSLCYKYTMYHIPLFQFSSLKKFYLWWYLVCHRIHAWSHSKNHIILQIGQLLCEVALPTHEQEKNNRNGNKISDACKIHSKVLVCSMCIFGCS